MSLDHYTIGKGKMLAKEKISLKKVLKYDPERTYIGKRYLDDKVTFSDVQFSLEGMVALHSNIFFEHSFLAQSPQGFHLSAMNVQSLVPYLCEQLATALLETEKQSCKRFSITSSKQQYQRFITEQEGLRCSVTLSQREGNNDRGYYGVDNPVEFLTFSYEFLTAASEKPSFLGTMSFAIEKEALLPTLSNPSNNFSTNTFTETATIPSYKISIPNIFPQVQCDKRYTLKDVYVDKQNLAIEGTFVNKSNDLAPIQIHGAAGLLMKGLFCHLFQIDRGKTLAARAYTISSQYNGQAPKENNLLLKVQVEREIFCSEKGLERWGFFTCHYTLGEYVRSTLRIAAPLHDLTTKEEILLRIHFQEITKKP